MDDSSSTVWPAKLTRADQRIVKERNKAFAAALKANARAHGWRYADGRIFRQDGEWFASTIPGLAWQRGAGMHSTLKPMAVDPLFWEIVGLPENNQLPLSFRANGAWVLMPPLEYSRVGIEVSDPADLAMLVLQEASRQLEDSRSHRSTAWMIEHLEKADHAAQSRVRALRICLFILDDQLDAAHSLCRTVREQSPFRQETGGFITGNSDGSDTSFLEQAASWIVEKKRSALRTI